MTECDRKTRTGFASLPWYDLAELHPATDGFWRVLARHFSQHGIDAVPSRLERTESYACQWTSPHFLFGQACGYDALLAYREHLQVVATPHYEAPGCDGPLHSSFIVVREDAAYQSIEDLRGSRCTFNTHTSHSGRNSLRRIVAPHHEDGRFFSQVAGSGSHAESLARVQRDEADVAAIDCVTHCLLAKNRPSNLAGTRILCRTSKVPAPPYVTGAGTSRQMLDHMRDALAAALDEVEAMTSDLLISGVEVLPLDAYEPIAEMERRAEELGYLELGPEPVG